MQTQPRETRLPGADEGCLLIADISGYTRYLQETELEHAQDVLADLTETVVERVQSTFQVSKLEGDAVFAFALDRDVEPSLLLDTIDAAYFAFRSRRRDVSRATSCDCEACVRIPQLNLKFVAHHGRFVRSANRTGEELTGSDVVLTHRLLKNRIREALGLEAYTFLTSRCVEALGIHPEALGMRRHVERYDDVGEVSGYVEDLEERWRYQEERRRVRVMPGEAAFEVIRVFPGPPELVWEFLTSPRRRAGWGMDIQRVDEFSPGGRQGVGTTNHCVHGKNVLVEEILDWRPFHYFTKRARFPVLGSWTWSFELRPVDDDATEVTIRGERFRGWRGIMWALQRRRFLAGTEQQADRLHAALEAEVQAVASG